MKIPNKEKERSTFMKKMKITRKIVLLMIMVMSFTLLCGFTTISKVVDFETSATTTTESTGDTGENSDNGSQTTENTGSTEITNPEATEDAGASTEGDTSKDDSNSSGSDIGSSIMGGDYQFGDDLVSADEDIGGFFSRIYNKLLDVFSGVQVIFIIILGICFLICLIMLVASIFVNQKKIPWYMLGLLIIAICIAFVIYAPAILNSFQKWFMTD